LVRLRRFRRINQGWLFFILHLVGFLHVLMYHHECMQGTGQLEQVGTADWTEPTLPSWRHSIWVGVYNPWPVIAKLNPVIWYKTVREIVTLERMHRAFDSGLMEYGMMKAVKKPTGFF